MTSLWKNTRALAFSNRGVLIISLQQQNPLDQVSKYSEDFVKLTKKLYDNNKSALNTHLFAESCLYTGKINILNENCELALKYFKKSRDLIQPLYDKNSSTVNAMILSENLSITGNTMLSLREPEKALTYLRRNLVLLRRFYKDNPSEKNTFFLASNLLKISYALFHLKKDKLALTPAKESQRLILLIHNKNKSFNNIHLLALTHAHISRVCSYANVRNIKKEREHLTKARNLLQVLKDSNKLDQEGITLLKSVKLDFKRVRGEIANFCLFAFFLLYLLLIQQILRRLLYVLISSA